MFLFIDYIIKMTIIEQRENFIGKFTRISTNLNLTFFQRFLKLSVLKKTIKCLFKNCLTNNQSIE